jgi:hypothetical protein
MSGYGWTAPAYECRMTVPSVGIMPPGTEFLDAETGRPKSPLRRLNARRDQNPGRRGADWCLSEIDAALAVRNRLMPPRPGQIIADSAVGHEAGGGGQKKTRRAWHTPGQFSENANLIRDQAAANIDASCVPSGPCWEQLVHDAPLEAWSLSHRAQNRSPFFIHMPAPAGGTPGGGFAFLPPHGHRPIGSTRPRPRGDRQRPVPAERFILRRRLRVVANVAEFRGWKTGYPGRIVRRWIISLSSSQTF